MLEREIDADPPYVYECYACGNRVESADRVAECSRCGGRVQNLSKPRI